MWHAELEGGFCSTVSCLQETSLCGKARFRENFIKTVSWDGLVEEASGFTGCVPPRLLSLVSWEEGGERRF